VRDNDSNRPIDPDVSTRIRNMARRMTRRSYSRLHDREDAEQELALDYLTRRGQFDPLRGGMPGFAHTIVAHCVSNVRRRGRAQKRDSGPLRPLTDAAAPPEDDEARDFAIDLPAALARLPDELRAVTGLLETRTVASVARTLRVSRQAVYARVREIRVLFERAGLRAYAREDVTPCPKPVS
jgi:RNA polymerase sigma factor (sigma-70 family)